MSSLTQSHQVFLEHALHQLPQLPLRVGSDHIMPASVIRDLGIYIDNEVSRHENRIDLPRGTVSAADYPSRSVLQSLVSSLDLSRPDYGNATLAAGRRFITSLVTAAV